MRNEFCCFVDSADADIGSIVKEDSDNEAFATFLSHYRDTIFEWAKICNEKEVTIKVVDLDTFERYNYTLIDVGWVVDCFKGRDYIPVNTILNKE